MFGLFKGPTKLSNAELKLLLRIEKKLDMILTELNLTFEDDSEVFPPAAAVFADQGNLIAAIKEYREATGAGLAESKSAIEAYLREKKNA